MSIRYRLAELCVQIGLEWIRIILGEDKDSQVLAPELCKGSTARRVQRPAFENGLMPTGI